MQGKVIRRKRECLVSTIEKKTENLAGASENIAPCLANSG